MNILWDIEHYLKRTGMTPTRFGRLAVRDPRLVLDLRRGREMTPRLEGRVRRFMAGHGQ
ncbi:MAG: hypothetical protein ACKOXK_06715 [Chakrabartia sp.]